MAKAVVDTTVLISAFITPESRSSEAGFLAGRGFEDAINTTMNGCINIAGRLEIAAIQLVNGPPVVSVVDRDPNDDMVIACALAAEADYIVSRDNDLLSLGSYQGIRMVTPRQFLDLLDQGS